MRINYYIITKTITDIINEIFKNTSNFPDSIKCILKMIDVLLQELYKDPFMYKEYRKMVILRHGAVS